MSTRQIPKISLLLLCFLLAVAMINKNRDIQILVTAPQGYSERFKKEFTSSHLVPFAIPIIETVIPAELPEVDNLLQHIDQYDYIAFSSRKAIEAFAGRAVHYPEAQKHFANVRFCAIGKDAEYMQERLHVANAVSPSEASPRGIANELAKKPEIAGQRIAVLAPRVEKVKEPDVVPDFLKQLEDTGLKVTRVHAYTTRPVAQEKIEEAAALITSGKVKCVAFTSGTEIEGLLLGFEEHRLPDDVTVACFGPYTAAYARKIGVRVDLVAKDFSSFAGFIQAIKEYYDR